MKLKLILPIALLMITFFSCKKDKSDPFNPLYDLDVPLRGQSDNTNAGFIKYRQDPDTARVIALDTRVSKLLPNHAYLLQRAVSPKADVTGCASNAWLTLGEGAKINHHQQAWRGKCKIMA